MFATSFLPHCERKSTTFFAIMQENVKIFVKKGINRLRYECLAGLRVARTNVHAVAATA